MEEKMGIVISLYLLGIFIGSGCIDPGNDLPDHPNFILHISNQSSEIDPVDVHVYIDEECVEDCYYHRGYSHNWSRIELTLKWGSHRICASTILGNCSLEREFDLKEDTWAVLDHYTTGFEFNLMDSPPMFM